MQDRRNVTHCIRNFCTLVFYYPLFTSRLLVFLQDKHPVWERQHDSEDEVSAGNGLTLLHVQT